MNTKSASHKTLSVVRAPRVPAAQPEPKLDEFDRLVERATQGDRHAIGAIAIACGPMLLEEARAALGDDFESEAEDVLDDFFLSLLEGETCFIPAQGRGLAWMCGIIRAMARRARAYRQRDWGQDDP